MRPPLDRLRRPVRRLRQHQGDAAAVLDGRRPRPIVVGADDDHLVVGPRQLAHHVVRLVLAGRCLHRERDLYGSRSQALTEPRPVGAADPHTGDRPADAVVGHEVLVGVAGVVGERPDEEGGARLDRRLEHVLEVRAERHDVLGTRQRAVGVDDAVRQVLGGAARGRQEVGRDPDQRDVVERGLAGDQVGLARVVGRELDGEAVDRRRVRHGKAVEGACLAARHDLERPVQRLPPGDVDRLEAHVVEPDLAEPVGNPLLCPHVGGVAGAADALGEDLADPPEDRLPRGDVAVGDRFTRCGAGDTGP